MRTDRERLSAVSSRDIRRPSDGIRDRRIDRTPTSTGCERRNATRLTLRFTPANKLSWTGAWWACVIISASIALITGWPYYRRVLKGRLRVEPSQLILGGLIGAIICLAVATGGYAWSLRLASDALSNSEKSFRDALVGMLNGPLSEAQSRLFGIFSALTAIDMGFSGDGPFFVMETVKSGLSDKSNLAVSNAANVNSKASLAGLKSNTISLLKSYRAAQDYLPKFVKMTNVNPNRLGNVESWLQADRECLSALKRLKQQFPTDTSEFNEQFLASGRGFDPASFNSLITSVPLPSVSERDKEMVEQQKRKSPVQLTLTALGFSPDGPNQLLH